MLSVYSGMDLGFTQTFHTSIGLARNRVASFDPEVISRQQQLSPPPLYSTAQLSSFAALAEPMLQSNVLTDAIPSSITTPSTSSLSPSTSLMYYDSYSPSFLPNTTVASSGTTNVSVTSSPSLDNSWGYALSTDLLPEPNHDHTFTLYGEPLPLSPQQRQSMLYSLDVPAYLPPPPPRVSSSQHQYHHEHDKQLLYPLSSSGVEASDPSPNFLSSHGYPSYQQHGKPEHKVYNGLSSSQTSVLTSAIITSPIVSTMTPTTTASSQRPNKRKRIQSSSPVPYSKSGRSLSMSPPPPSDTMCQHRLSKARRHHYGRNAESNGPRSSTGSMSPKTDQVCSTTSTMALSGSIPHSSMNMISSFPTKINTSSNTSTKRYECHICSKKFTRPSSLTTHIYSHTKEKPFKCPVEGCGRHFSVVSNLRRHAKIHSSPSNVKG